MIGNIETNVCLSLCNLLHYSGDADNTLTVEMDKFMATANVVKCGNVITSTNSVRVENGQQIIIY